MLILFDIDLTLVRSHGVGMACMERAGRDTFGDLCSPAGIPFGGQLDPIIFDGMLAAAGLAPTPDTRAKLTARYVELMEGELGASPVGVRAQALPGVVELLDALERTPVTLGLLTGNLEPTGRLKLRSAGLDAERFAVRVWGDDGPPDRPHRSHLPPVALERFRVLRGVPAPPERVVIVGDTVRDVEAARTNGCRSLAVATGRDSAEVLAAAGADRVVGTLEEAVGMLDWMVGS